MLWKRMNIIVVEESKIETEAKADLEHVFVVVKKIFQENY